MSYDNVYNSPERHRLSIIGELNDPAACYTFNNLVVWRSNKTGQLYWATDSGCSCPSPFEDHTEIDHLVPLTEDNWSEFVSEVKDHAVEWDRSSDEFQCDKNQLLATVNAFLRPPTRKEMDDAIASLRQIVESLPR